MSVVDTAALRATAEAATPGPWHPAREAGLGHIVAAGDSWAAIVGDNEGDAENAAHIAAFDPPTVLALLAELDTLRATVARIEALADNWEADDETSLDTYGQHLMGGAVLSCAEHLCAALVSPTPDPTTP